MGYAKLFQYPQAGIVSVLEVTDCMLFNAISSFSLFVGNDENAPDFTEGFKGWTGMVDAWNDHCAEYLPSELSEICAGTDRIC